MERKTPREKVPIRFRGTAGRATYEVVSSPKHSMWGRRCCMCGFQGKTGAVFLFLWREGYETADVICGVCVSTMAEAMPADATDERMAKVASKSKLVDWIKREEVPMESL